ncbi:MAG: undecaprenyldiphospho-muramoylpentapeptide beta-N-acetylglucosaminyltransferase [bacterium]|nr:undecaprenyldiphospho-muramoylpentapeptide beta-N-acetylglucosaminyltransferase [bacterium]MCS7308872.1 undecaprenyldiphospho-muramoylpentapeptide beta-N-acetylglucosaminyltransferase [Armatimonadota bacterium]
MRVLLAGGGTGGHLFPAVSIAEALREHGVSDVAFAGRAEGIEGRVLPPLGWRFFAISAQPLRRSLSPFAVWALWRTVSDAHRILRAFAPDVLVATGGYVAAGVVIAQALRRGKVVLHEQNAIPGRTNRWLARWARRVCITFEGTARYFEQSRCVRTGLPVRRQLLQARTERQHACASLGLEADQRVLFVIGGSQGARQLNEWTQEMLPALKTAGVQVMHQVGERHASEWQEHVQEPGYRWFAFLDAQQLGLALSAADFVLSRAGASTLSEIALFGKAALLVPYPYAYADHQWYNAQELARGGGALVFRESELDAQRLLRKILELMRNDSILQEMGERNRRWAIEDAAERVVQVVMEVAAAP